MFLHHVNDSTTLCYLWVGRPKPAHPHSRLHLY